MKVAQSKLIITTLTLLCVIGTPAFCQDGLVAHWSFDENTGLTASEKVNGLDGTLVGGACIWINRHCT